MRTSWATGWTYPRRPRKPRTGAAVAGDPRCPLGREGGGSSGGSGRRRGRPPRPPPVALGGGRGGVLGGVGAAVGPPARAAMPAVPVVVRAVARRGVGHGGRAVVAVQARQGQLAPDLATLGLDPVALAV